MRASPSIPPSPDVYMKEVVRVSLKWFGGGGGSAAALRAAADTCGVGASTFGGGHINSPYKSSEKEQIKKLA